jgi:hypothetical protein
MKAKIDEFETNSNIKKISEACIGTPVTLKTVTSLRAK